jgi:plasmid stabilization system protein ParE
MTPVWSPEAIDDLAALRANIEQDNPAAARRVVLRIIENVETLLPNNPEMGRPGRVSGNTRTRDPEDPVYRSVPSGWQHAPDAAHLSRCSSMAERLLKIIAWRTLN